MAQTDRLYKLKYWLDGGRCVTREFLLRELQVSPATLKRDVALLRDRLNAPHLLAHLDAGGLLGPHFPKGAGCSTCRMPTRANW